MGYFPFTVKKGFRCSAAVGYLNPIKKRKNLKILTNAHIKNIEFENKKAKNVNYWMNNNVISVKANKEIILSAGTIGSPHILQASGIGPGELLKNNNIETVIHMAALSNDPLGEFNKSLTYEINYKSTLKLATLCKKNNISKFVF